MKQKMPLEIKGRPVNIISTTIFYREERAAEDLWKEIRIKSKHLPGVWYRILETEKMDFSAIKRLKRALNQRCYMEGLSQCLSIYATHRDGIVYTWNPVSDAMKEEAVRLKRERLNKKLDIKKKYIAGKPIKKYISKKKQKRAVPVLFWGDNEAWLREQAGLHFEGIFNAAVNIAVLLARGYNTEQIQEARLQFQISLKRKREIPVDFGSDTIIN